MVIITRIDLKDEMPVRLAVDLTIEEAAQIAKWTGTLTTGQTRETSEIYDSLVGGLFNRWWNDGLNGYMSGETE